MAIGGIPIEFFLFGLTLLGVALLHHHTLRVALVGLAAIVLYKLVFTGFKAGPGLSGLVGHRRGCPRSSRVRSSSFRSSPAPR